MSTSVKVGQRVAYGSGPLGAYSTERNMPADKVIAIPDSIGDTTAAAMMLKGMTAQYLLRQTYVVKPGDTILFHAAAGGVGLIAGQWAKHLGATVIGTAGNKEKAELAKAHGYDHVILYREENIAERVKELTGGKGVPVVYDGVGKDTFEASLDCCSHAACWSASATPRVRSPASISAFWPPRARSTSPGRHSSATPRPGPTSRPSPADLVDVVAKGAVKIEVNQTLRAHQGRRRASRAGEP